MSLTSSMHCGPPVMHHANLNCFRLIIVCLLMSSFPLFITVIYVMHVEGTWSIINSCVFILCASKTFEHALMHPVQSCISNSSHLGVRMSRLGLQDVEELCQAQELCGKEGGLHKHMDELLPRLRARLWEYSLTVCQ